MTFDLLALRFELRAIDPLYFPPLKGANIFRGALGDILRGIACRPECPGAKFCGERDRCAYARLFEPVIDSPEARSLQETTRGLQSPQPSLA